MNSILGLNVIVVLQLFFINAAHPKNISSLDRVLEKVRSDMYNREYRVENLISQVKLKLASSVQSLNSEKSKNAYAAIDRLNKNKKIYFEKIIELSKKHLKSVNSKVLDRYIELQLNDEFTKIMEEKKKSLDYNELNKFMNSKKPDEVPSKKKKLVDRFLNLESTKIVFDAADKVYYGGVKSAATIQGNSNIEKEIELKKKEQKQIRPLVFLFMLKDVDDSIMEKAILKLDEKLSIEAFKEINSLFIKFQPFSEEYLKKSIADINFLTNFIQEQ